MDDLYRGQITSFCFPGMTWADYDDISMIVKENKDAPQFAETFKCFILGYFDIDIKPYKERTKEYVIELIQSFRGEIWEKNYITDKRYQHKES